MGLLVTSVNSSLRRPRVEPVWAEGSPEERRPGVCGLGSRERLFTWSEAGETGAAWREGLSDV